MLSQIKLNLAVGITLIPAITLVGFLGHIKIIHACVTELIIHLFILGKHFTLVRDVLDREPFLDLRV